MLWFIAIVVLVPTLIFLDYCRNLRHKRIFRENGFKGPTTWPFIGSTFHLMKYSNKTFFNMIEENIAKCGKTFSLWFLSDPFLYCADPKLLEPLLQSQQQLAKAKFYDLFKPWLGLGLLVLTGKQWHSRRKLITPTFHFKILEQFTDIFEQQAAVLVDKLYEHADGKTVVDISKLVTLMSLDVIAETSMGVKINAQKDPNFPYAKSLITVSEIIAQRVMQPMLGVDLFMRLLAPRQFKLLNKNIAYIHSFGDKIITERRDALQRAIATGTYQPMQSSDVSGKRRMALLDVLLHATTEGAVLSNEDIRAEVNTFMFEGHDTTTSGISHALYLIARHAEVQDQLFEEIRSIAGDDKNKPLSMQQLQEMKYLDSVIKESQRLHPSVSLIGRYIKEDTMLDGKLIPAGTYITLLLRHAMRDPDYFKDPNCFKPERFCADSEYAEKINPFSYIPFSAGPRNCIGQKFAILEMKSCISQILRNFELLPLGPTLQPQMHLALSSANGVNLGLKPRVY